MGSGEWPKDKLEEGEDTGSPAVPLSAQMKPQAIDPGPLSTGEGWGRLLCLPVHFPRTGCDGCQGAKALFGDTGLGGP